MDITLSVDDDVAERARRVAQAMGKTLNQMLQDYLQHLSDQSSIEADLEVFERSALQSPGASGGQHWNRDEANSRS